MANILNAIVNIVNNYQQDIVANSSGNNRANNMGDGLEEYIANVFAGTYDLTSDKIKLEKFNETYSYKGNRNNPPDLILKNSDAIEIKKLESKNSAIALNSSYPKSKLYKDSTMITKACKECEKWDVKDMLYAIGQVRNNHLKSLWLVYGDCFCAEKEIYERIKDTISSGISNIDNVEFTKTKELGKVKKVDPLGITDLRIRGMWHVDNPNKVFSYIYEYDDNKKFQLIALIAREKYKKFPLRDREALENIKDEEISLEDVKIKNPNNPVQFIDAKLILFKVD